MVWVWRCCVDRFNFTFKAKILEYSANKHFALWSEKFVAMWMWLFYFYIYLHLRFVLKTCSDVGSALLIKFLFLRSMRFHLNGKGYYKNVKQKRIKLKIKCRQVPIIHVDGASYRTFDEQS